MGAVHSSLRPYSPRSPLVMLGRRLATEGCCIQVSKDATVGRNGGSFLSGFTAGTLSREKLVGCGLAAYATLAEDVA